MVATRPEYGTCCPFSECSPNRIEEQNRHKVQGEHNADLRGPGPSYESRVSPSPSRPGLRCHRTPWPFPLPENWIKCLFWLRLSELIVSCKRRFGSCSGCGGSGSSIWTGQPSSSKAARIRSWFERWHLELLDHDLVHPKFLALAVPFRQRTAAVAISTHGRRRIGRFMDSLRNFQPAVRIDQPLGAEHKASAGGKVQRAVGLKDAAIITESGYFLLVFHPALADQPTQLVVGQPQLAKGLDLDGKIPRIAAKFAGKTRRFGQITEHYRPPVAQEQGNIGNRNSICRLEKLRVFPRWLVAVDHRPWLCATSNRETVVFIAYAPDTARTSFRARFRSRRIFHRSAIYAVGGTSGSAQAQGTEPEVHAIAKTMSKWKACVGCIGKAFFSGELFVPHRIIRLFPRYGSLGIIVMKQQSKPYALWMQQGGCR